MLSLMKYFFFLVLCGLPLTSVAQKMVIGTSQSFRQTQGRPYEYADSVWVDSSRLTLFYRHERMVDSTDRTMRWSLIRMRIGEGFAQQTDMHIYLGNRRLCAMVRNQDMLPLDCIGRFGDNNPPYWADMILDRRKREMKITCCNFYSSAGPLTYREDMPELTWDLLDGTEEVCGYECHMAQTSFRGRIWKVWYSTELPIDLGPWKLSGLPGLILKAIDRQGAYSFVCTEILSNPEPIYEYIPRSANVVSRKDYLRYEKLYHKDPQYVIAEGEEIFVLRNDQQGLTEFDEFWEIPYNPIELE